MAIDFSKFDAKVDLDALKDDVKKVEEDGGLGEYEEVPVGEYEVRIDKLELGESKSSGNPMVICWFKILEGKFKNSIIFMNQVVNKPFQIHLVKEFLKSLESTHEIDFESYSQFANLIMDVAEDVMESKEYVLEYGENDKGYKTFEIKDVFDVE